MFRPNLSKSWPFTILAPVLRFKQKILLNSRPPRIKLSSLCPKRWALPADPQSGRSLTKQSSFKVRSVQKSLPRTANLLLSVQMKIVSSPLTLSTTTQAKISSKPSKAPLLSSLKKKSRTERGIFLYFLRVQVGKIEFLIFWKIKSVLKRFKLENRFLRAISRIERSLSLRLYRERSKKELL